VEEILLGTTDRTILVFIPDPASTDGSGKTGLTHADLMVSYTRVETDNDVVVTDVTSSLTTLTALTDAHADWGVKEVSSSLAPGLYRLDVADAVFAIGAWYAVVYVEITTSAAAATPKAFKLVAHNVLDGVRLGLTALPNAAADAAGGLPISDAGGLDLDNRMPAAAAITNLNTVFNTDFASNYDATADRWKSSMTHINGTAITGTGSRVADSFVAMLNIASPVFTVGSVNQTGDSFARIGAAGASLTDLGGFSATAKGQVQTEAEEALAAVGVTTARMGYVDNLNVGGAVASSAQVAGLNVNTRANLNVPIQIETPDASTQTYKIRLHLYDLLGNMEAPDSTPTVTLTNAAGTDRSSRLSAASNPSTGVYTWDYTATAGDAEEQLIWVFSVVEGGTTRTYPATSYVVEYTAYRFDSSDRTKLNAIHAKLPSKTYLTGTANSDGDVQMDEATGNFPGSVGSINGVSFPSNFASMSITAGGIVKSDLDTIKTQTVTCGASVTILASVGTAATSTAQTGDSFARIGATGSGLTSLASQASVDTVDTVVDAIKIKTDNLPASPAAVGSAMTLTTAYDLYHADIHFTRDQTNTTDEYEIRWFKNGLRVTSGITSPTIQVVNRSDGSDLIAATALTQIGSAGAYKLDATGGLRLTVGQSAEAIVSATIDSGTRTFSRMVGRDST
jgi:hypothetical protein